MAALCATALVGCSEPESTNDTAMQGTAATAPDTTTAQVGVFLSPNDATREQLLSTGLDSTQIDALLAGRPYTTMTAVDSALGLTEEARERVYAQVWMPIDLNTASDEEILLIPGIGERMLHEFEEYRPYRGMEQFRREIGKYVDEAEVARLERYVTIR